MKKIEPYTRKWHKEAYDLALSYCIIAPCAKCGHPVVEGYVCRYCGTDDPKRTIEEEKEWEKKYSK